jgi:hypothetical protein
MQITGIEELRAAWKQERQSIETQAIQRIKLAVVASVRRMQAGTPVWSGETVRNYGVVLGVSAALGGPVEPIDNGPPGDTNKDGTGPLGPERRRGPNEQASLTEIQTVLGGLTKLQSVTIINRLGNAKWSLVDSGLAPNPPGSAYQPARYPGGISVLGEQTARLALGDLA